MIAGGLCVVGTGPWFFIFFPFATMSKRHRQRPFFPFVSCGNCVVLLNYKPHNGRSGGEEGEEDDEGDEDEDEDENEDEDGDDDDAYCERIDCQAIKCPKRGGWLLICRSFSRL